MSRGPSAEASALAQRALKSAIEGDRQEISDDLDRALRELHARLLNPSLRIDLFCIECGVNVRWLRRRFNSELGLSPQQYISRRRMEVARILLGDGRLTVSQVAELVAFKTESGFVASFKKWAGESPGRLVLKAREARQRSGVESDLGIEPMKRLDPTAQKAPKSKVEAPPPEREALESKAFKILWKAWRNRPSRVLATALRRGHVPDHLLLIRRLLRYGIEECRDRRQLGAELVELAVRLLPGVRDRLTSEEYSELSIEALATLGNAKRLSGDWHESELAFARAKLEMTWHQPSLGLFAKFHFFRGVLDVDRRRLDEARETLDNAVEASEQLSDPSLLSRTLLARGKCREFAGQVEEGVADYRRALDLIEQVEPPDSHLMMATFSHLMNGLAAQGELGEATRYLRIVKRLVDQDGGRSHRARVSWMSGLLDHARGRLAEAQGAFHRARADFLSVGEHLVAAVLGLDQALVCHERSETLEAQKIAWESLQVLKAADLEREALAALELLDDSIRSRTLEIEQVLELRAALETKLGAPQRWR